MTDPLPTRDIGPAERVRATGRHERERIPVEAEAAELIARRYIRGAFRYSPGLGWFAYTGTHWSELDSSAEKRAFDGVRRAIQGQVNQFLADAAFHRQTITIARDEVVATLDDAELDALPDPDEDNPHPALDAALARDPKLRAGYERTREHHTREGVSARIAAEEWTTLLSAAKFMAILQIVSAMEGVLTRHSLFDSEHDLLNCANGVVDLRTGFIHPHDARYLFTKVTKGHFRPGHSTPDWDQALTALPEDVQRWAQVRFGQSATGHPPDDDTCLVMHGGGSNGKTAVVGGVVQGLGDYARTVPHKILLAQQAGTHTTELTTLRGLRMALLEETPEEGRLDTHTLKMTVGSMEITARRMRENDITFAVTHTMWINTNFLPQVDSTDHGTWRRLRALTFPYVYRLPGEELRDTHDRHGDRGLKPRIAGELAEQDNIDAALSWVVEGAMAWYAAGCVSPADPDRVAADTARWRKQSDVGMAFAEECLIADPNGIISSADMIAALNAFLAGEGKPPWSNKTIMQRLPESARQLGFHFTATPAATGRVRAEDVQTHQPHTGDPWSARAAVTMEVGSRPRLWRGARFKSADDLKHERQLSLVSNETL